MLGMTMVMDSASLGGSGIPIGIIGTKFGPNGGGEGDGLSGDASHTAETDRFRIDMPNYDVELTYIEYWNGYIKFNGAAEANGPNAILVKAAWESAAGVLTSFYDADGSTRVVTLQPGERRRLYPASKLIIPASTLPYIRNRVSVGSAGQQWPANRIAHGSLNSMGESNNQFGTGAGTDQVDATGEFGTTTNKFYAFGPCGIYGVPVDRVRRKRIALFGDSMCTVSGVDGTPNYGDTNGYAGYLERAINSNYATITAARASSRLQWVVAGMANQLALIGPYVSSAIIQLGPNDIFTGRTLLQVQTDLTTLVTALQAYGIVCYGVTVTPRPLTTSNSWVDGGATLNASAEAIRQSYNTWLKTLPIGLRGVYDVAAAVEDAGRPGYWNAANPAWTPDGTHLAQPAMTAAVSVIDLNILV